MGTARQSSGLLAKFVAVAAAAWLFVAIVVAGALVPAQALAQSSRSFSQQPSSRSTAPRSSDIAASATGIVVDNIVCKNEGGPEIDRGMILAHVSLREGKRISVQGVAESIRALYATGLFDFVAIDPILNSDDASTTLQISYISRPLLVGIYFEGNKEWESGTPEAQGEYERIIVNSYDSTQDNSNSIISFFRGKLIKECTEAGMVVGSPLDRVLVARALARIKKKYELKYPFAEITDRIDVDEETQTARVTFTIVENLNTRIKKIDFIGNKSFSDADLRYAMQTSPWAYTLDFSEWPGNRFLKFSPIRDLGRFSYSVYKNDLNALVNFYQNKGYLDAKVYGQSYSELSEGYCEVNNEETEGSLSLEIVIDEGILYSVGDIKIEGNSLGKSHARFTEDAIRAMLAKTSPRGTRQGEDSNYDVLLTGMAYSPRAVNVAMEKIREYYGQVGYLNCRVNVKRSPDIDTGQVALKFIIDEGEKSYLRSIRIEGNTITKSEVILRELVLAPGEVFDLVRMKTSESRIKNTSYFRQNDGKAYVSVNAADTNIPGQKDLVVSVREAPTGTFSFGGSFSTVESLSGYIEFTQSNFDIFNYKNHFRGGGQKFRFRVQIGLRSSAVEHDFEEPMIFGREISVGYNAYYKVENYVSNDYDTARGGVKLYARRRLFERIYAEPYYQIENVEIYSIDSDMPQFIWDEKGYTLLSRGGLTLSRDTRDSYIFPNSGTRVALRNELTGGPFGGDCTFYHLRFDIAHWIPLFDYQDQTLKLRLRADTTHAFGNSYVPFFERIKYGGPYSLRGFKYGYVSPFEGDEPKGGNSGAFVSVEYTIKIIDQLRFAVFYDGGFVNDDSFDFSPRHWCDDVGFGFRMMVMGALLNLDIGFPIHTTDDNDDGMRFNISFGTSF